MIERGPDNFDSHGRNVRHWQGEDCARSVRVPGRMPVLAASVAITLALATSAQAKETQVPSAVRVPVSAANSNVQWFENARFGVFIHWGLYSQSGGEWRGKRYYGITEWLMKRGKIPLREYATLASHFDPEEFDAQTWARAIKAAGARYIVITAKHHDGFAMFASKTSSYNIAAATPFKRDPLRELVVAARAEGLKVGFYYSQVQDWSNKDAAGNDWDFPEKGRDFQSYLDSKAIPQIRELLTNYGPIDIIWFDTPLDTRPSDSKQLYNLVKSLQPNCLVSSRVGNGFGDFMTYGDGEIPASPQLGRPWEAIFTHNDSWGYSRFDQNFKPAGQLISLMATAASKGGNILINIGPDASGRLRAESVARFAEVGRWLQANGSSIYGTSGVAMTSSQWGVATRRGDRLFLHTLTRPDDGRVVVPGVTGDPRKVMLLATGARLDWRRVGEDLVVTLPAAVVDARDTVVMVDGVGAVRLLDAAATLSRQFPNLVLDPASAVLTGAASHTTISSYGYFGDWKYFNSIDGLRSPAESIRWTIRVDEPGEYRIEFAYSADHAAAGQQGTVEVAGKAFDFQVLETGTIATDRPITSLTQRLGTVHFAKAGRFDIVLRPRSADGLRFHVKSATLTPVW